MRDLEAELSIFYNHPWPQVKGLRHHLSQTFNLQFVLPLEYGRTRAWQNHHSRHQRDSIHPILIGADAESHSQILVGSQGREGIIGRTRRNQKGQGHTMTHRIMRTGKIRKPVGVWPRSSTYMLGLSKFGVLVES